MKQNERDSLKHVGIQFFAESSEDPEPAPQPEPAPIETPAGKTYTQEQLNSMMANEKRTARQALLKELGFDIKDDKDYRNTVKSIKDSLDAGKTQQQLDAEARSAAETAQAQAEAKATRLEMKVAALSAGVNPEFLDDVIVLAQSKVSEDMPVDKVLAEFKTKYPAFFKESSSNSGTGRPNNPARKGTAGTEGLGKRLAKSNKPSEKSAYFKN
jgi:hypothetical protein